MSKSHLTEWRGLGIELGKPGYKASDLSTTLQWLISFIVASERVFTVTVLIAKAMLTVLHPNFLDPISCFSMLLNSSPFFSN